MRQWKYNKIEEGTKVFHHWLSTDGEIVAIDGDSQLSESHCIQCGVIAPEWQHGAPHFVSVSHGVLPLLCNGPQNAPTHVFVAMGGEDGSLECAQCAERILADTAPDTVDWECVEV